MARVRRLPVSPDLPNGVRASGTDPVVVGPHTGLRTTEIDSTGAISSNHPDTEQLFPAIRVDHPRHIGFEHPSVIVEFAIPARARTVNYQSRSPVPRISVAQSIGLMARNTCGK